MIKKCDVLYIHSTKNPTNDNCLKYAYMPMGIIGILNNLRVLNFEVYGINYAIEKTLDPDFNILTFFKNIEYKVLLTDLHWYEHAFGAMHIVSESKKAHPEIPTIIGGYTSTIYSEEIMKNFNDVDYVVTGDSDLPMEMLIKNILKTENISVEDIPNIWYRKNKEIIKSNKTWVQTDLDNINFIDVDFFEHSDKIPYLSCGGANRQSSERWICIARGCKFNCAYCCGANKNMNALFNRCNILLRSPKKVAEDFCKLAKQGINHVSPSHDLQMFGEKYYKEIFSNIRKSGSKPGMYLECFQLPTKEFINEIEKTFDIKNTILALSPISGNEKLRKENGKIFNNNDFYNVIEFILSKKISVQVYYTANIVGETKEEFMDTYFQMQYLHVAFGFDKNQIFYQRIVIDPLAGMRDFKGIEVTYNTFMDYYEYCKIKKENSYCVTGFGSNSELTFTEKKRIYNSIFSK